MAIKFLQDIDVDGELQGTSLDINGNADISGSITASSLRCTNIVTNKVVKFNGTQLDDANITDTGSLITLGSNTVVSGELEATSLDINGSGNLSGTLTIPGSWASTILDGDNVVLQKPNYSGGWARALMNFKEHDGTSYYSIGAFGSSNTFTYGYLGTAYNNTTMRWATDKTVTFGGAVVLNANPTSNLHAATKAYVDGAVIANTDTQDLSISGQTLSLTNGGSVTLPTQTTVTGAAGTAAKLTATSGITTQPGTNNLIYSGQISAGTAGLFATSDNSNSIITLNRHSGNYDSQLGFSSNGYIYYRKKSNTTNNLQAWKILTFSDSTEITNKLLKTGGTMTGKITLDGAPTSNLHAATKAYVDGAVIANTDTQDLSISGTTLSLTNSPDVTIPQRAVSDSTSTTSSTTAASSTAVKSAYDRGSTGITNAASAQTTANAALPKSGGTMTGAINMGNNNISGVNAIQMADPGPSEGVNWTNIKIFESPNDLTTNTSGNFQVVHSGTRRLTVDNAGIDVNGNLTMTGTLTTGNGNIECNDLDVSGTITGDGSSIDSINGSNISSGTVAAARVATLNQNTTGSSGSCTGNAATATNVAYTGLTGTVPTWNQNTTGNAATATLAATSTIASDTGSATHFPVFVDGSTGSRALKAHSSWNYNPGTSTLTAGKITTDVASIVENNKSNAALMTLTGQGAGNQSNISLHVAGNSTTSNVVKIKMTALAADDSTSIGAGILSYLGDGDTFNIGQSTTHNSMAISIDNDDVATFTNAATLSGGFVLDGNTITGIDDSGEFTDDDTHIMTSAGINDKFAVINANTTGSSGSCTGNSATATALTSGDKTITGNLTLAGAARTLTNSTGDLTVDVAGDIILDADSNDVIIKDAGAGRLTFNFTNSGHFYNVLSTADKTWGVKGTDGSTAITALAIDMANAGKATFNNDVVAFSDRKLKENIQTLDGKKVLEMRGVSFVRKDTKKQSSGVIAQEIQKVAPELVSESEGTLGVAYGNLVGYLIEAVKDQQKQIDELKAIVDGNSK